MYTETVGQQGRGMWGQELTPKNREFEFFSQTIVRFFKNKDCVTYEQGREGGDVSMNKMLRQNRDRRRF